MNWSNVLWMIAPALLIAACAEEQEPSAHNQSAVVIADNSLDSHDPATDVASTENVEVQLLDGAPAKTLQLLPQRSGVDISPMSQYLRDAGFECDTAISARQLQEDGEALDIFKIDCANGKSFQATMMNESTFFKPWTGKLIGQ